MVRKINNKIHYELIKFIYFVIGTIVNTLCTYKNTYHIYIFTFCCCCCVKASYIVKQNWNNNREKEEEKTLFQSLYLFDSGWCGNNGYNGNNASVGRDGTGPFNTGRDTSLFNLICNIIKIRKRFFILFFSLIFSAILHYNNKFLHSSFHSNQTLTKHVFILICV
jgi:hypothetical protein